jgi:hypothetical protein
MPIIHKEILEKGTNKSIKKYYIRKFFNAKICVNLRFRKFTNIYDVIF